MFPAAEKPILQSAVPKAAIRKRVTPKKPAGESLGDRLRRFRKAKGLTQTELGEIVGISQRLMTYYETQGGKPSADLLARFAEALDVSTDVLLGRVQPNDPRASAAPETLRLWRRFRRIEDVPARDQKTILKMIDALADRGGK
jgi:transcriptional regulator with XRE-family HTH domain